MSFYSLCHPTDKLLTAFWSQTMYFPIAGIPSQLPSTKLGPKNAAYFWAKMAITFEPEIPQKLGSFNCLGHEESIEPNFTSVRH